MKDVCLTRDQWFDLLAWMGAAIDEAREFGADDSVARMTEIRDEIRGQTDG